MDTSAVLEFCNRSIGGDSQNISNNNMQAAIDQQQVVDPTQVDQWIQRLEQWTSAFYSPNGSQDVNTWNEAQNQLVEFQKCLLPLGLYKAIIEKSNNDLVLFQAASCLKGCVTKDWRQVSSKQLEDLFQFLCEFLCAKSLDCATSTLEAVALVCAIILKREVRDNRSNDTINETNQLPQPNIMSRTIMSLCATLDNPNEQMNRKYASIHLLNSLILECQGSKRSSYLGLQFWRHFAARRAFEAHLPTIAQSCLKAINWSMNSNLLVVQSPTSNQSPMAKSDDWKTMLSGPKVQMSRESQVMFNYLSALITAVENTLSWNSVDVIFLAGTERLLRAYQQHQLASIIPARENRRRTKYLQEWNELVTDPNVVAFLFQLYANIKSMVRTSPNWDWPRATLKRCMISLFHLVDLQTVYMDDNDAAARFVTNVMQGTVHLITSIEDGIDDYFEMSSLLTPIALHLETEALVPKIDKATINTFIQVVGQLTCKMFTYAAKQNTNHSEDDSEKTVDLLLDVWAIIVKASGVVPSLYERQSSHLPPLTDKSDVKFMSPDELKVCTRALVESYLQCHLHKPEGLLEHKQADDREEFDVDGDDEDDDATVHVTQLESIGSIARVDCAHATRLLTELMGLRIQQFEALLTQSIPVRQSPAGMAEWEVINDDLHWLLLIAGHYLTQEVYGVTGLMCPEILNYSVQVNADINKTVQALESFDASCTDIDPIVRLVIVIFKLFQIEKSVCQSNKSHWISPQTTATLTTFVSKFALTYIHPIENDYSVISMSLNYCFGQDSKTAEKVIMFILDNACCKLLAMKDEPLVVRRNVELFIQMIKFVETTFTTMVENCEMLRMFVEQLTPNAFVSYSPEAAKGFLRLATKLFKDDDRWRDLLNLFKDKWISITTCIAQGTHQNEMVVNKFLEFCDFSIGVSEACDDLKAASIFEQLLLPIVRELPSVMYAFRNFDSCIAAIFEFLTQLIRTPVAGMISGWEGSIIEEFYLVCKEILENYSRIMSQRTVQRKEEEESCEDIVTLISFLLEVMRKDWGSGSIYCPKVVITGVEVLRPIIKPEFLQFPKIRQGYYKLLMYLCDEDDRLSELSDSILENIVEHILISLKSQFDKEIDSHCMGMISLFCVKIYKEHYNETEDRLTRFVQPLLPALFDFVVNKSLLSFGSEYCDNIASAFFSLRVCFPESYTALVETLIAQQQDQEVRDKVRALFVNLDADIMLRVSRFQCRQFSQRFEPFLAELQGLVCIR